MSKKPINIRKTDYSAMIKFRAVLGALCFVIFALVNLQATNAFAQSAPVEAILKQAKSISQTAKILDRLSSIEGIDDDALVGASVKYQNVIADAKNLIDRIEKQSTNLASQLTDIGPPPEDKSIVEPKTVSDARAQLTSEKSTLAVTKNNLENLISAAQNSVAHISTERQATFTATISKKTHFSPGLFSRAAKGAAQLSAASISLFSNWMTYVINTKFWEALGSAFISLATALFLSLNFRRYFADTLERKTDTPNYFIKVFTAFWATILPSAATAIFLGITFTLFTQFNVFTTNIAAIVKTLFLSITGLVFAWNFCRAEFSPKFSQWRLVAINDDEARKLFWLTLALFVVYAFDTVVTTTNATLSGPLEVTVVQGILAALLIGIILLLMAAVIHNHDPSNPDGQTRKTRITWHKIISLALLLSAITIIGAGFLGYIGFARFFAQQIVVTGGILAIMTVGIIAARELGRQGVLADTGFGHKLINNGVEPYRIEQASLGAGAVFIFFILSIGIPALFMQWGTRYEEITAFVSRTFDGVQIGGIRFSLSGILLGLLIFVLILLLTRLIQRWLARSVLPRSNIDPGVSDSIKAGIGYVGFAIAGLLAVTSAGFDLSSLAIVAGALSLGIGFGLQNIVSNFVSGLILLVERPIKVGDWIVVGAAEGTVKRISVRATEIETFKRQSIIVPNSELINSQVGNWTFKSKNGRVDVPIGVAYGSDVRMVERILYEISHAHAMVSKKPEPSVWFSGFGDSSLDFRLRMHLYDINNLVTVETEVRFEILRRFEEENIDIPFPQRDINVNMKPNTNDPLVISKPAPKKAKRKTAPTAKAKKQEPG